MSETNPDKLVGAVIQNRRLELGISQGELAHRLRESGVNWSQGTLSRVELGERPVRLVEAAIVAEVLKIDIMRLLQAEQTPIERIRDEHRSVKEQVQEVMAAVTRTYGLAANVKELLEAHPDLWEAIEESENPRPANPGDYPTWLASGISRMPLTGNSSSYSGLGPDEFDPPFPVETPEDARAFMTIPRAVISRSIGVWVNQGDGGSWEPVPEDSGEEAEHGK